MPRWKNPLSVEDLAEIIRHAEALSAAELALELARTLWVVRSRRVRLRRRLGLLLDDKEQRS